MLNQNNEILSLGLNNPNYVGAENVTKMNHTVHQVIFKSDTFENLQQVYQIIIGTG